MTDKRAEFERHLWNHAADAFQVQFDERRDLNSDELALLADVHQWVTEPDEAKALSLLRTALIADKNRATLLLQMCGLTRNKIITDLKASPEAKKVKIPGDVRGIAATTGWLLAGPYLLTRLRAVLGRAKVDGPALEKLLQAVNQATWPGYIRQQRGS